VHVSSFFQCYQFPILGSQVLVFALSNVYQQRQDWNPTRYCDIQPWHDRQLLLGYLE
jgi:hypothetical protein